MEENSDITQTPEYQELQSLLVPFLGSTDKFNTWMLCENPMLGGVAPIDMLFLGRSEKLLKWVREAIKEHEQWQQRN